MKIGIDISQIVYEGTGVARFTEGLVDAILRYDKNNEWIFFFSGLRKKLNEELEKKIKRSRHKLIKWKLPPSLLSLLFNDLHKFSPFTSLDWFITSDWTEPPTRIKKATVVHDLVYLRYPETVDKRIKLQQRKRLNLVKKESRVIFADSKSTKDDLVKFLEIPIDKIHVIYPGVEIQKPTSNQIKKTLEKYQLDNKSFILTVGKIEPRKNIKRLIEAFTKLPKNSTNLVIVGPKGWGTDFDVSIHRNIRNRVFFLGYVSDEELYSLYLSCIFFIYPSIWEGFGYPVVEAITLGTPVATSNNSSLAEIGKDVTLLFNPFEVDDIKNALQRMIDDGELRKKLSEKGKERSKFFNWKNYYEKTIKVLNIKW